MYNERPIFWPVFWAMFAALVAFNVLKWGLAALLAAGLVVGLNNAAKQARAPTRVAPVQRVYQPETSSVPSWPGPLGAQRQGSSRACIGGVEADRVSNGWRQRPNQPCEANSN